MKLQNVRHLAKAIALFLLCGIFTAFGVETLSLADIQKKVLENNLDLKIAYEKYYQAQKGVSVARGEFLPGLSGELARSTNPYSVAQALVPTPSQWFNYKASKRLKVAESFAKETITLNIFEGISKNYYEVKANEKLQASLEEELVIREKLVKKFEAEEELGYGNPEMLFNAKRVFLQTKQKVEAAKALIARSKSALNIAMAQDPTFEYDLAEVEDVDDTFVPEESIDAQEIAVTNSPELKQNSYLYQAAKYDVKSATWSFISFEGIGFEYTAVRKIEKSQARGILLKSEQIEDKIRNQIHYALKDLKLHEEKITINEEILPKLEKDYEDIKELYKGGQISLEKYIEAEVSLVKAHRNLTELEYAKYVKLSQIRRLLGLNAEFDGPQTEDFNVEAKIRIKGFGSKKKHYVTLEGDLDQISHVTYTIEELDEEATADDADDNFRLKFKAKRGAYTVTAEITLLNGEVVTKEIKL